MSRHVFCPHCDAKLKFKKPPQKTIHCPRCKQPIEPAHFQSAVEATAPPVEESPPADPVPPAPSDAEETETYSFSAPAPKMTPARSAVDDDLAERIERQIKPKKKKKKESEAAEDDDESGGWFEAGIMGLVGSAFFLFYGGMGGGVTFLHIIDFSPGFIFGTGVVMASISVLALAAGIYEVIKQGYSETVKDKYMPLKHIGGGLLILGMAYAVFVQYKDDQGSADDNEAALNSAQNGSADPSTDRNDRGTQPAREREAPEPEGPGEITVVLETPPQLEMFDYYRAFLKMPFEGRGRVQAVRKSADQAEYLVTTTKTVESYARTLKARGFLPTEIDVENARITAKGPSQITIPTPARIPLDPSVLKPSIAEVAPGVFSSDRERLSEAFPNAEVTPLIGKRGRSVQFYAMPSGGHNLPITFGRCRMRSLLDQECLSHITLLSKAPTRELPLPSFEAKDGFVLTGITFSYDEYVIRGMRPHFTRYSEAGLVPSDTYTGEWIGPHEGFQTSRLERDNQLILGVFFYSGPNGIPAVGAVFQPQPDAN